MTSTRRTATVIDAIAEQHLTASAATAPFDATAIGLPGYDREVTDFSPAGSEERAEVARATLARLETAVPEDDVDRVTLAALRERLGVQIEQHDAGMDLAVVDNISSPVQEVSQAFDLMPQETPEEWEVIADRLEKIPFSLAGYVESLHLCSERGALPARRQLRLGAEEAGRQADRATGYFAHFVRTGPSPRVREDEALMVRLEAAADRCGQALEQVSTTLASLTEQGRDEDGVGREHYQLASRGFLGATVDLDETYEWGTEQLLGIIRDSEDVAERLTGARDVVAARAALDADPAKMLHGVDELQRWMQDLADQAVEELSKEHFEITGPMRELECRIATTGGGGIYYTGPSDDFSRPGRMWWDVVPGETEYHTWTETTTVYHEGVPGHHLQIATAVANRDVLNSWRRLGSWVSGHGEGWALYAEKLMADLGYLDDGDLLGMLDSQRLRAARVVLDIGVHLGKPVPESFGGGTWTYERAQDFMTDHCIMTPGQRRFELNRYLGWPGQAPSYAIGQRLWEQIRDERKASEGTAFSLKAFHREALALGSIGLDTLRDALAVPDATTGRAGFTA